jgi:hypothetical protein
MSLETKQRSYLYTISSIGVLLVFTLMVQGFIPYPNVIHDSSLSILPVPAGAEKYPDTIQSSTCSPTFSPVLDESSKVKYQIKTPHLLPVGYSLQGVDVVSSNGVEMVTLYYWNKSLCNIGDDLAGGPALNGAVIVRIANSLRVPEGHAEMIQVVNKVVPKYNMHQLVINGKPAIGYDSSSGLSINAVNSVEDEFPYPARIFFVNNKILYNIEANMPLEDLVKIAESIK